jgi:hypothetical protein
MRSLRHIASERTAKGYAQKLPRYTHLWWHLAILYLKKPMLASGSGPWIGKARWAFEKRLWPKGGQNNPLIREVFHKDPQVQINALGLLWRLEPALQPTELGVTTSPSPYIANHFNAIKACFTKHVDPLLDILYLRFLPTNHEREMFVREMRNVSEYIQQYSICEIQQLYSIVIVLVYRK